jgi:hypothetical protein
MGEPRWRGAASALLWLVLLGLGGCADQARKQQEDLADVLSWLPGHYDNLAQVQHDAQFNVHPPHDHVALLIMPTLTPRLGHHVLYVQEMAPDNAERIMTQRMFSFDVDEDRGVVGLAYTFVEPARWREAAHDPQMLTAVMTTDVVPGGCELIWKRAGEDVFTASTDPKRCHAAGGAKAAQGRLTADSLTLGGFEFRKLAH